MSTKQCPQVASGVQIHAVDGAIIIDLGDRKLRVGPDVGRVLALCDGQRCVEELAVELSLRDGKLAPSAAISGLCQQLAGLGAIEMLEREKPVVPAEPPRHDCSCCGCSCEGQLVGPLSDDEVARLRGFHKEFGDSHERVAKNPLIMSGQRSSGPPLSFLNSPNAQCLFLGEDRLCLIHGKHGELAKPEACRLFPFAAIEVEGEIRLGVRPMCYERHKQSDRGEVFDPRLLARMASYRPVLRGEGASGPALDEARVHEAMVLGWLRADTELTLVELLYRLSGAEPAETVRSQLPAAFCAQLVERFREAAPRLSELAQKYQGSLHGQRIHALLETLGSLPVADGLPRSLPPAADAFARWGLEQAVMLRDTSRFPSVFAGVLAYALGSLAALWCAPEQSEAQPSDAFAHHLAAYHRLMSQTDAFIVLFDSLDAAEGLLDTLAE
ncbi:MAG: hypothetical protein RBU37_03005 [Myxococcota bacterium]|jgi:Fe-S-cluster containining protein|nr:hypothetical protein [Myxococcota bacterium]